MFKVKLGDFHASEEQKEIVNDIINSGMITEGKFTRLFENAFAEYVGVKHCVACSNGTAGLMLVLKALNVIHGRKLTFGVPALTFPATLNAVILTGNNYKLFDVGKDMLFDIKAEDILRHHLDGILPVHLFGYSCDMKYLSELKEKMDLLIVEDACEATGSTFNGVKVGTFGNAGVYSLFMGHVVGVGELGCVTTNDDELARIMRSLKNHGRVGSNLEFKHDFAGYNFKITEFMAGMALASLKEIPTILEKRQAVAFYLNSRITSKNFITPLFSNECGYLGYPLIAKTKEIKREVIKRLNDAGVETRGMFPCLASQNAYSDQFDKSTVPLLFPNSFYFEEHGFYIPCHQYLNTEDLDVMVGVINSL